MESRSIYRAGNHLGLRQRGEFHDGGGVRGELLALQDEGDPDLELVEGRQHVRAQSVRCHHLRPAIPLRLLLRVFRATGHTTAARGRCGSPPT